MIDTMTVLAYLLMHDSGHSTHLQLNARFPENTCAAAAASPQLQWKNIPPEASSLALIIKDSAKTAKNPHYYWVVYNLPIGLQGLIVGANKIMNPYEEGKNSWGKNNYHAPCWGNKSQPVEIELFALDKRFSARYTMTGEKLEKKIKSEALASVKIVPRFKNAGNH